MSELKVCPKCGKTYSEPSALSREDNETEICPECGTREALEMMGIDKEKQDEIISEINRRRKIKE